MLISWDFGTKNDLGLYDTGMCPSCNKRRLHTTVQFHKHFIISFIPVYLSNKYYRKCKMCDNETLLDKKEAKQRLKEMKAAFPEKDPFSKKRAEEFFNSINKAITDNDVINMDDNENQFIVNINNKEKVKDIVWQKYKFVYLFPRRFYDDCVEYYTQIIYDNMYSANVLLKEIKKNEN